MEMLNEVYPLTTEDGNHILYAPLRGAAMLVNKDAAILFKQLRNTSGTFPLTDRQDKVAHFLESLRMSGVVNSEEDTVYPPQPQANFKPTNLTLLPTFDCHLRCVYCYASSGDLSLSRMSWPLAKAAVDLVITNAAELKKNEVRITFLGGGEPTRAWSLLTKVVEYARVLASEHGIHVSNSVVTNGMMNDTQRQWMVEHMNQVQVSFDGTEDIQNSQRPAAGGRNSFDTVLETVRFFDKSPLKYNIHAVITDKSAERMVELVDFFAGISSSNIVLHFEPLFESGRCSSTGWQAPNPKVFVREYIRAWKHAASLGRVLVTSLSRLNRINSAFCGAAYGGLVVTPDGLLTSCMEVSSKADTRADIFVYGEYDASRNYFTSDAEKLQSLASLNVYNRQDCSQCAFKWHCSGGCLTKSPACNTSIIGEDSRCYMTRAICTEQLQEALLNPELQRLIA